ncbi:hypothetical protein LPJ59_004300, partial [Coemansia sp. RSA 2399]
LVNYNYPVRDPMSSDLTCNVGGVSSVADKTCPVDAGSTIMVTWHGGNDTASDGIIDASHLGPCLVYVAPLENNGQGDVWFKIFEEGYNSTTKLWCVDKIRANHGMLDITLPSDIKAGDYLLRTEVIALQEAFADDATTPAHGAQYYPNCAQVAVSGGGDAVPKGYAIPGIYHTNDPGIFFNIYVPYDNYTIPGPPVYVSGTDNVENSASDDVNIAASNLDGETDNSSSQEEQMVSSAPVSSVPNSVYYTTMAVALASTTNTIPI